MLKIERLMTKDELLAFADQHELTVVAAERYYEPPGERRWYAYIQRVAVKELSNMPVGNGDTPEEALAAFAAKLTGLTLIIGDPGAPQEIKVEAPVREATGIHVTLDATSVMPMYNSEYRSE